MLKLLAEIFALAPDASEDAVVAEARKLKKHAGDRDLWKARAEDNLKKLEGGAERDEKLKEAEAENFFLKAKATCRITAAEEPSLRKMYMSGPQGREVVEELIEKRADQEYLARVTSLQNVRHEVADPLAERDAKAAEIVAKSGGKVSLPEAIHQVHTSDPELFKKVEETRRQRQAAAKGGER